MTSDFHSGTLYSFVFENISQSDAKLGFRQTPEQTEGQTLGPHC